MFHEYSPTTVLDAPRATPSIDAGPRWRLIDLLAGAGLVVMGAVTVIAVLTVGPFGPPELPDEGVSFPGALLTLLFEAWLGVVVLILARVRGISLRDLGLRRPRDWSLVGTAVTGAYLSVLAYALLLAGIERATGSDLSRFNQGNTVPRPESGDLLVWVVIGLALVVAAPLAEELFFRGLVFRAVAGMRGFLVGLVVSGLAFSLVHANASVVVPFAVVGMIFAWAYRASGSLWTTIAAHAIFNGVGFVALVLGVQR